MAHQKHEEMKTHTKAHVKEGKSVENRLTRLLTAKNANMQHLLDEYKAGRLTPADAQALVTDDAADISAQVTLVING